MKAGQQRSPRIIR